MIHSIILLLILINSSIHALQKNHDLCTKDDFESIEIRLLSEPVIAVSDFHNVEGVHSTHKIRLITLKSGLKALFKTGEYHYAEVAGYRLSKLLNMLLVPPTVFRTIEKVRGSLQLYIQAPSLASIPNRSSLLNKIGGKAISEIKLFYYLAGQWDTHYGNQLIEKIDRDYKLWIIDHSGILHRSYSKYGDKTFIEKGTNSKIPSFSSSEFPFNNAVTVKGRESYTLLSNFINSKKHLESLIQHPELTYIIWNSTLWLAHDTEGPARFGRFTKMSVPSILNASMILTEENLSHVWRELLVLESNLVKELIKLTLSRRDELIDFFS